MKIEYKSICVYMCTDTKTILSLNMYWHTFHFEWDGEKKG
jgi:hypothetical protein